MERPHTMSGMALAKLIESVVDATGWSYADIAKRGTRAGRKLTKQDVSNFRNLEVKAPSIEKIKALADGLGVPAYRVVAAILSDHDIDLPVDARTPEAAIEHDPTLTPRARRALLLLLESERSAD